MPGPRLALMARGIWMWVIPLVLAGCAGGPMTGISAAAARDMALPLMVPEQGAVLVGVVGDAGPTGLADSWDLFFVAHDDWFAVHAFANGTLARESLGPAIPGAKWQPLAWSLDSPEAARLTPGEQEGVHAADYAMSLESTDEGSRWCVSPGLHSLQMGRVWIDVGTGRQSLDAGGLRCRFEPLVFPLTECASFDRSLSVEAPDGVATLHVGHPGHKRFEVHFILDDTSRLGGPVVVRLDRPDGSESWSVSPGEVSDRHWPDAPPGDYSLTFHLESGLQQHVVGKWTTDTIPEGGFGGRFCP